MVIRYNKNVDNIICLYHYNMIYHMFLCFTCAAGYSLQNCGAAGPPWFPAVGDAAAAGGGAAGPAWTLEPR